MAQSQTQRVGGKKEKALDSLEDVTDELGRLAALLEIQNKLLTLIVLGLPGEQSQNERLPSLVASGISQAALGKLMGLSKQGVNSALKRTKRR